MKILLLNLCFGCYKSTSLIILISTGWERMANGLLLGLLIVVITYFYNKSKTQHTRPRNKSALSNIYDSITENLNLPLRDSYKTEKVVTKKFEPFLTAIRKISPNAKPFFFEFDLIQYKETLSNGLVEFGSIEYNIIDSYEEKRNSVGLYRTSKFAISIKATLRPDVRLKAQSSYFYDVNKSPEILNTLIERLKNSRKYQDAIDVNKAL